MREISLLSEQTPKKKFCLVAIVKNEEKFIDEWLIYHYQLGFEHFFLYDNDPELPLKKFLKPHAKYCTIIPWIRDSYKRGNQIAAYNHALTNYILDFEWVAFLDVDEYIVLREHNSIDHFIASLGEATSVSLNWHFFGHNGFFNDPKRLITTVLTRRRRGPSKEIKSITRTRHIEAIVHPHYCQLKNGGRVDANNQIFKTQMYPGKTAVAHINHYHCRSFSNWMQRPKRGDVNFNEKFIPPKHQWRLSEDLCLKAFVALVAKDQNEYVDEFMFKYRYDLQEGIKKLNRKTIALPEAYLTSKSKLLIKKQLDLIVDVIILNYQSITDIGLFNGKTGLALFLFNYAHYVNDYEIKQLAHKLIDEIGETIDTDSPPGYAYGLAGYGIAIETSVVNSFLKIDTNEVLEDLDTLLHFNLIKKPFSSINTYHGICGLGKYYISRLNNPINAAYHNQDVKIIRDIEKIIDLLEASFDTYNDCLSVLDFLSDAYEHCDDQQTKIKDYLHYAAEKIKALFYEDNHLNIKKDDFNPLGAIACLMKTYRTTGDDSFHDKAMDLVKIHKQYYDDYLESKWLGTHLAASILYLNLAETFGKDNFKDDHAKWLGIIIHQNKKILNELADREITSDSLGLFSGIAGKGMLLLAILQADGSEIMKLFPF